MNALRGYGTFWRIFRVLVYEKLPDIDSSRRSLCVSVAAVLAQEETQPAVLHRVPGHGGESAR